jgi:deazaflavin-dependent oxidoreductase (nitroreductase family)
MGFGVPWLAEPTGGATLERSPVRADSGVMTTENAADLPPIPTHAEVAQNPELLQEFNARIVRAFRANRGVVGGPFEGSDVVLVTVTGARSGIRRVTPLEYFTVDGRIVLLGTYGGAPRNPAWVHNLRAHPDVTAEIGERSFTATACELSHDEARAAFDHIAARLPRLARYPRPDRHIPVFELQPT